MKPNTGTAFSSTQAAGILLIRVAVLAGLLGGLARTWADPDLWGHVRFGGDILRTGLLSVDPYSFTSDIPWVKYAIWHFAPRLKVSMDGRRETVYSDVFVARHTRLYYEPETSMAMLDELRPDFACLPANLPLSASLNRAGWHRIYTGPISIVFAREGAATLAADQKAAPPIAYGRECFPGP